MRLLRVPIKLGTHNSQALLDTGAQLSIMAVNVFSKIPRNEVKMIKSPEQCYETITTVSGERLNCIGQYEVPFTLYENIKFRNIFLIIPRLDEGIILGIDFITKHDIIIQPGKRLLSFGKNNPPDNNDTKTSVDYDDTVYPIFNVSVTTKDDYERFRLAHLSHNEQEIIGSVLAKYSAVFKQKTMELGSGTTVKHAIHITGPPVFQPLRRLANSFRPIVKAAIDEMLEAKVIRESASPFASPVVIVPKPKSPGEWRFCVDYRKVNELTIKDMHPLPRIDATLDALQGAKYFTTLDLLCGYWQIEIEEQHKHITAFICEFGQFEWNRMSFGLCNAPATFQRFMNSIFRKVLYKSVLIYLDDVIIFSKTLEEHAKHIEEVLQILETHRLKLKLSKCFFAQLELEFLGFIINALGVRPDGKKIEAVQNYPEPRSQKELQSLLGLANYYRRFVRGYAEIAHPLTELTRKNIEWVWGDEQRNAFNRIKTILTSRPLLSYPDFSREFIIQTDASGYGLGAVLSQMQRSPHSDEEVEVVIAYASRHLNERERKWSTTEKECLAIIYAVTVFRPYVYGRVFTCVTDHRPLEWLMSKKEPTGKLERWALKLQEYQMKIGYRSGLSNQNADCLSRTPLPLVATVSFGVEDWVEDQAHDEYCKEIIRNLGKDKELKYVFLQNGLLAKKDGRVVVPLSKRKTVLSLNHDHKLAGHLGISKTLAKIKGQYTWPQLANDVMAHIRNCIICAKRKTRGLTKAPLQSLPVYEVIWETMAMDIVGPLTETREGYKYILVASDYATRFVITRPMKDQSASTVARIFVEDIILEYGAPQRVLTDQGRNFVSELVSSVCDLFEIDQLRTTAYHPQTDGLVERFNKTMVNMLSAYVVSKPENWKSYLKYVTAAYNTSIHSSMRFSPYYLLYGREANLVTSILSPQKIRKIQNGGDMPVIMHKEWRLALELAKEHLASAKATQKWYYDLDSHLVVFEVGEKVLLHEAVTKGKFHMKWEGPFVVLDKISDLTYRIQNEANKKISIVHVNRLVPYKIEHTATVAAPKTTAENFSTTQPKTKLPSLKETTSMIQPTAIPTVPAKRGRPKKTSSLSTTIVPETLPKRKLVDSRSGNSNRKTVRFADPITEVARKPVPKDIPNSHGYNLRSRRTK